MPTAFLLLTNCFDQQRPHNRRLYRQSKRPVEPAMSAPTSLYSAEYPAEYNGDAPDATSILFIVIAIVGVSLRFYAHRLGIVAWGLDDTLLVSTTIFCLGVYACCLSKSFHSFVNIKTSSCSSLTLSTVDLSIGGLGYRQAAIVATEFEKLIHWANFILAAPLLYLAAALFPKLAILAIYLRIFTTRPQHPYRWTCWVLAGILIATWFANTLAAFLMCTPLDFLWDKTINGHCFDIHTYYIWSSLPNILTDVLMLVLPLPLIWKLHTSHNIKIGFIITFAIGSMYDQKTSSSRAYSTLIPVTVA